MSELSVVHDKGRVLVSSGDTAVAEYCVDRQIERVNTPKSFFHPLRTLGGIEVTGFAPEDHVWHHGLEFAFPRVGGHNLWGGGTYLGPDEGYRVLDDHGSIRHDSWQDVSSTGNVVSISHRNSWLGHGAELLLTENRHWAVSTIDDALVFDLATTLHNVTDQPIELATPAQRGRPDGGYGGLFLRLGENFAADALFGGDLPVTGSGHASRTLVVHGRTGAGELVTLGSSFLPGSPGVEKWLYRFEPFSAIGWAVAYDEGLELPVGGGLTFNHRLALLDGHVDRAVVEALL